MESGDLQKLGGGSQLWRAVSVLETDDGLIWGTDDPVGQNHLVKLRSKNGKLEKLKKIAGPAYYSATTASGEMGIATTVENRKKHRAIIYRSFDGVNWSIYRKFKKDFLHSKYFGYGVVNFIHNQENLEELVYFLSGLHH